MSQSSSVNMEHHVGSPKRAAAIAREVEADISSAAARATVTSRVIPMHKADNTSDFFVAVECAGRRITPYVFAERWKAEYEAATFRWLFNGGTQPDLVDFDPELKERANGRRAAVAV